MNTNIYAILPKELFSDDTPVQRHEIRRNWYGTKQAAKVWNDKLNDILVNHLEMNRNPVQPCNCIKLANSTDFIKCGARRRLAYHIEQVATYSRVCGGNK